MQALILLLLAHSLTAANIYLVDAICKAWEVHRGKGSIKQRLYNRELTNVRDSVCPSVVIVHKVIVSWY